MNNIKKILKEQDISIAKLSEGIGIDYPTVYYLVNRKDLSYTTLRMLNKVSEYLDVGITELYK